jgi:hypothetical protein
MTTVIGPAKDEIIHEVEEDEDSPKSSAKNTQKSKGLDIQDQEDDVL